MESNTYQKIIEDYIEASNNFDVENMLAVMHDDIKFENITDGHVTLTAHGRNELRQQTEKAVQMFEKWEQKITSVTPVNDQVEVDIYYHGILAVDLLNGLKAGDKIEQKGKSVFRFKDDKIIELKDIS